MTSTTVFLEIGRASIRLFDGTEGVDLAFERTENGRLSNTSKATLVGAIQEFLRSRVGRAPTRALCAVGAQGVTLRKLRLPRCSQEELEGVMLLQIESEFPLPPDQLAWGYFEALSQDSLVSANSGGPEVLVFALKADSLEEYSEILTSTGLTPSFTLAPFARRMAIPTPGCANFSILHISEPQCELACFEGGALASVRLISSGFEVPSSGGVQGSPESPSGSGAAASVAIIAKTLTRAGLGDALYLSGDRIDLKIISNQLAQALGGGIRCEVLEQAQGLGRSAVTLGLTRAVTQGGGSRLPLFRIKNAETHPPTDLPIPWKWIARAAALLVCALGLRYLEPAFSKARITKRLAELKVHRDTLPSFEKELGFLRHLEKNHAMIQDTIYVVANAAPQGTRIESLSISKKGEVSLRTSIAPPPQAVAFRSKLTDSGFFSTVVVEEQSPSPDRQKTTLRISALPKPGAARPIIPTAPASGPPKDAKVEKPKPTGGASATPGKGSGTTTPSPPGAGNAKTNN